ncbi:MAG: hypothetical protein CGW95_12225 [Phenylobacterium zucineum]|nr:MAG: hypothetical protein CGW95_12225 [Phenylobacterium zucineum]
MAQIYDAPYDDFGVNYDTPSTSANDGNAGEWSAQQYMQAAQQFVPQDSSLHETLGGAPTAETLRQQYDLVGQGGVSGQRGTQQEDNVFSRISGKLGKGLSDSFDKDPLKFLEAGLGGVAGMWKAQQARDAAQMQANSVVAGVNARAAAEKDAQDRYNASFSNTRRAPTASRPLVRMDGSQVFDANGRLKG